VQQQGLTVAKSARNFLLIVGMYADRPQGHQHRPGRLYRQQPARPDQPRRRRGRRPAVRRAVRHAHLAEPDQAGQLSLTPADVTAAIKAQNAQVSAGQLGGTPNLPGIGSSTPRSPPSRA
jgi:multidrug efflux pump